MHLGVTLLCVRRKPNLPKTAESKSNQHCRSRVPSSAYDVCRPYYHHLIILVCLDVLSRHKPLVTDCGRRVLWCWDSVHYAKPVYIYRRYVPGYDRQRHGGQYYDALRIRCWVSTICNTNVSSFRSQAGNHSIGLHCGRNGPDTICSSQVWPLSAVQSTVCRLIRFYVPIRPWKACSLPAH